VKKELPNINHETVVFTKHARERLELRRLSEDTAIQIMRNPKQTYELDDGKIKFVGKKQAMKIHTICKPIPEENKWVVISVWVRGEDDAGNIVHNYHRKSGRKEKSVLGSFSALFFVFIMIVFYFLQQR
jgi:hypothetical protein